MLDVELSFRPVEAQDARAADQPVEVWSIQSIINTKWLIAHDASNHIWKITGPCYFFSDGRLDAAEFARADQARECLASVTAANDMRVKRESQYFCGSACKSNADYS